MGPNKVGERFPRLTQPSQIRGCCRNSPPRPRPTGLLRNSPAHPRRSLGEPFGMKLGDANSDGGIDVVWIERANSDRVLKVLNGKIRLVEKGTDKAAVMPCPCRARIKLHSPINNGAASANSPRSPNGYLSLLRHRWWFGQSHFDPSVNDLPDQMIAAPSQISAW